MPQHTRRQFLRVGVFGTSFTLIDLLRSSAAPTTGRPTRPKSAVMVFLPGGPSQLDTFDPKPAAPAEIRGEFGTVRTTVPGVRFCEHLPLLAASLDKFAVLRAVTGMPNEQHNDIGVMTGYPANTGGHPSIGAVVSKIRGATNGVPPFVTLRGMSIGCEPGFLGISHRPYSPGGQAHADLKLPTEVTPERLQERQNLLRAFDTARRDADATGAMTGMDGFQRQAFEMITSDKTRAALDISREPQAGLERYAGVEQFLKARRLVEVGVGCVTLSVGEWDTHKDNFARLKEDTLPALDRGVSALIADLHDRGLAGDVVVLVWGEFGRTPRVNKDAGRDHWLPVMSALIAGGGLKSGRVIGATTSLGDRPKDGACTVQQVLAAVYTAIGIDPGSTLPDRTGRPVHLLEDRASIRALV